MALKFPARVRSATSTTGTGTYTLSEPTSAGWRNFTRAVVQNDLASGDQVGYAVIDTTADPVVIELGQGTYDNTAKTLTRDVVYQPNGSAVSWGAGTRDVIVLDLPQVTALLQGDQTIAGVKTLTSLLRAQLGGSPFSVDSTTALVAQRSGAAGDACRLALISGNAGSAEVSFGDSDAQYRGRITYGHVSERFDFYTGGVLRAALDATSLRDAAGNPYIALPSGGRLLWGTNSIPPGWTIVASLADKIILTTSTASEIDDVGGSWTFSGVTIGNTTLTEAQIPAHVHGASGGDTFYQRRSGGAVISPDGTLTGFAEAAATASTGGGSAHTHTFVNDAAWRPSYQKWGVIQKS